MKKIYLLAALCIGFVLQAYSQRTLVDTTLYFDVDKYDIKKVYEPVLNRVSESLSKDSSAWAEVSGHADITGAPLYNQKLSLKRTESVIKYLHKNKIADKQVKGFHYGSSKPIATNSTKAGRAKNRRVHVVVYTSRPLEVPNTIGEADDTRTKPVSVAANPGGLPDSLFKEGVAYSRIPVKEEVPMRTEIDVFYNKEDYAYFYNSHRTIVHTIREAEMIIDTNTMALPPRGTIYKNDRVRMNFAEMDKKGEMLYHRVSLRSDTKENLDAAYILCLDLDTLKLAKDKKIEFYIPEKFVKTGTNIYYSEDQKVWSLYEKPKYNSFHRSYAINMQNDGCFAVAGVASNDKPVSLSGKYYSKIKGTKITEDPEFYFVYKNSNTILAADEVGNGQFRFNGLKSGETGTLIGVVKNDGNIMFLAKEELTIKSSSDNHNTGNVKFSVVNHFEMERALLGVYKDN